MAGASCGRSVLNSWASRRSGPVAASCSFRAVGLLTVSGKQYRPLPGLNSPLKSAHQRSFGRGAGRERRACTQRSRQPIGGRRKRVSRRGRFARASAGCQAGLPLGSRRRGGQPVGAISAGPTDRLRGWDAVWGWLAAPLRPIAPVCRHPPDRKNSVHLRLLPPGAQYAIAFALRW
jgi:hypothetical protein